MKCIMIITFLCFNSYGQAQTIDRKIKNVAWIYPTNVNQVNGILFNFLSPQNKDLFSSKPLSQNEKIKELDLKTNGLDINLDPIGLVTAPLWLIFSIYPEIHEEEFEDLDIKTAKRVNGLQIGAEFLDSSIVNGIDINLSASSNSRVNGISITPIINKDDSINGLSIAGIGNHVKNCNGLQIALFNSCYNLRGIQLGLWNINQKRSLPFINWNF